MNRNKSIKINFFLILIISIIGFNITVKYSYANNELNKCSSKSIEKKAYITIDDGPSKYTNEILDVLNKYNAKATFFMIDYNMRIYKEEVNSIIDNGNTPGFHSVTHDIHELYKTSKSAKEEFDINKETLMEVAGIESNIVRLPYGSKPYTPDSSYESLVEAGYKMWDWNIDTEDWKVDGNQILEKVKTYSKDKNNIVILMHERKETANRLDKILNYLSQEGYEFVPIDENEIPQNFWLNNLRR